MTLRMTKLQLEDLILPLGDASDVLDRMAAILDSLRPATLKLGIWSVIVAAVNLLVLPLLLSRVFCGAERLEPYTPLKLRRPRARSPPA